MGVRLAPVKRWIICITGFGQHEGGITGVEILQDALRRLCSCGDTVVLLKSWRDNPRDLAKRIHNHTPEDANPAIVIIGYSWGGYTAVLLAKELRKWGLDVEHLLLCDAVWRSSFIFGYPLSLLDIASITIPDNVHNLMTWRQRANLPKGAKINLQDRNKTIWLPENDIVFDYVTHQTIDDQRSFSKKAMEIACPKSEAVKGIQVAKFTDLPSKPPVQGS